VDPTAARLFLLAQNLGLENILVKTVGLRINLNLDGVPITSHSQTSRLLTSSLSLGVPVPRPTQCIRGV
jgi:hypothetical protein